MDALLDSTIMRLEKALKTYTSSLSAVGIPESRPAEHSMVTRSKAARPSQSNQNRCERLHRDRMRADVRLALDGIFRIRSMLASSFDKDRGVSFRCQQCQTLSVDIFLMEPCHHRICYACLSTVFRALLEKRVEEAAVANTLPISMSTVPPTVDEDYIRALGRSGVRFRPRCSFCSALVWFKPHKIPLYGDILKLASQCVHSRDGTEDGLTSLSVYFL
ncbi:unnamed protein product [Peniophora sp. CBMAI 1063]|nr:unnamed protein product [Peniophora sp. CBMAI 1063]